MEPSKMKSGERRIVATNSRGDQLVEGPTGRSIINPNPNGTNCVYHVGSAKYVSSVWDHRYAKL